MKNNSCYASDDGSVINRTNTIDSSSIHNTKVRPFNLMSPFYFILKIAILYAIGVMALSPQDAIHADDLERYQEFMNTVSDSQFLDMYMESADVKIDIYEYPSNDLVQSAYFKPSPKADQYFQQEKEQADALQAIEDEGLTERAAILLTLVTLYNYSPRTMRSVVLFRVALGLLAVDFVGASPCKPISTATPDAPTETSLVSSIESATTIETATSVASATSTATTDSSAETSESSIVLETSSTIEAIIITTTAAPTTETTSAAPIPTFTVLATGQGPMAGRGLQTYPYDTAMAAFDAAPGGDPAMNAQVSPFTIDSQGRLVTGLGLFLCGLYSPTNFLLDAPAVVTTCNDETPLRRVFLNCKLSTELKVQCSIPAVSCVSTGPAPWDFPACQAATGTWGVLSTAIKGPGHVLHIGNDNTPSYYDRLELSAEKV
ncbi:unnamed protein product [Fusarium graminearum]|nr:unnamed protein product [Fusarium graminearum]